MEKTVYNLLSDGRYDEAREKLFEYIKDNSEELSGISEDVLKKSIAGYMKDRDRSGKFYGYLSSYNNPLRQLFFQRIRYIKPLCKILFSQVRRLPDRFFYDRYKYDAEQFLKDMLPRRNEFIENIEYYDSLYDDLNDTKSKKTLICLIGAAVFFRYEYYELAKETGETDYYPSDIFPAPESECIADCGGYTGDTAEWLIKRFGNGIISSYYLFEPDKDNATIAEGKFQDNAEFHIKAAAVSEEDGFLSFNASGGASGYVGSDGKDTVPSVALDSFINEKLTYIKMDIEGAELSALRGGTKHIGEDAPKLAICAYHKPDDLRVLIGEIKSIQPGYQIFLRHYSPKHKETVIFCRSKQLAE